MHKMKITKIEYNHTKTGGCNTCDYGAVYINDITIQWEDKSTLQLYAEIEDNIMTEANWMLLLANTSNKEEIIAAWKHKYRNYLDDTENVYIKETTI